MKMQIETENRKAFELVTAALMDIDRYKKTKDFSQLEKAKDKLDQARKEDPNYLRAIYFRAILNDLMGKSADAIIQFEEIMNVNPPFIEEVRYNLAISYYHRYSWKYLDVAMQHFNNVIKNTVENHPLHLLSRAGLAQTYAMRMIPKKPQEADLDEIKKYFKLSQEQIKIISKGTEKLKNKKKETKNEINWAMLNAEGMSLMYFSDYFGSGEKKLQYLKKAQDKLKKADHFSPKNWANYCDLGSSYMRVGYWSKSTEDFYKAIQYLSKVINSLRPNYGFALYEMGRTYRLMRDFSTAVNYFNKAMNVEPKYRDVGNSRIKLELDRAEKESTDYP